MTCRFPAVMTGAIWARAWSEIRTSRKGCSRGLAFAETGLFTKYDSDEEGP